MYTQWSTPAVWVCFTLNSCKRDVIHHKENVPSSHPNKKQSNEASVGAVTPTLLHKGWHNYILPAHQKTLTSSGSIKFNPYRRESCWGLVVVAHEPLGAVALGCFPRNSFFITIKPELTFVDMMHQFCFGAVQPRGATLQGKRSFTGSQTGRTFASERTDANAASPPISQLAECLSKYDGRRVDNIKRRPLAKP